jgi:undecaprenyl-diphosphatase
MALLEWLKQIDTQLFLAINGMHTTFLDAFFSWFTCKEVWLPFYFVLLVVFILKYKGFAIWVIVLLILAIVASDQLSGFIKFITERPRPSHQPSLASAVHTTFVGKGGAYGFVSSHAANAFALTLFTGLLTKNRNVVIALSLWAILTAYSRLYVGVHYPFDVLAGALLGGFIGWGAYRILHFLDSRYFRKELAKINHLKTTGYNNIWLSLLLITTTLTIVSFLMIKYKIPYV